MEAARNFCNKVYNAARFVLMNIDEDTKPEFDESKLSVVDKWILAQLDRVIKDVTANLDAYELNLAAEKIYDFIWGTLCDWYIELAKPSLYSDDADEKKRVSSVLLYVLSTAMKLLHPFMQFITEELYQRLPGHEETIMLCAWPKPRGTAHFEKEEAATETLKDVVRAIRNVRAERKVPIGLKTFLAISKYSPSVKSASNCTPSSRPLASSAPCCLMIEVKCSGAFPRG